MEGKKFEYHKVSTGREVWDEQSEQMVPEYHTLRSYFAHSTEKGPGPGWDARYDLLKLSEGEMMARYGHIFTPEEVDGPSGTEDFATGERVGGMPGDVPYYELVAIDK